MKYFLARLAGARVDIVRQVPGSLAKQSAMGAVLLTTAGFAAVSAAYALNITGVASGWVCVIAGLIWGVAILNLDRMLVLGLSGERSRRKTIMLAVPRVGLAVIIGIVISTPLMLKIFDTEISSQMNKNILAAQEQQRTTINDSTANSDLAVAEDRLTELRVLINAGPTADPSANPKVKAVENEIARLEQTAADRKAEADQLRAVAVAEEEGSAGTGIAGCAAMCVEKKRLADEAQARWQQTLDEIAAKKSEKDDIARSLEGSLLQESENAIADAEAELPTAQLKVDQLREQIRNSQDTSFALEEANTGIIARLKALDDLSADSPTASAAHMMVALLFMCIEILPVLFKVLSNFGSPSAYDKVLESYEGEEVRTATADVDNRHLVADLRRNAALDSERKRIEKQQQTIQRVNDAVLDHQSAVVDQALAEWAVHARRASAERIEAWADGLTRSQSVAGISGTPGGSAASTSPSGDPTTPRTTLNGPGAHLVSPATL